MGSGHSFCFCCSLAWDGSAGGPYPRCRAGFLVVEFARGSARICIFREGFRHLAELVLRSRLDVASRARLRATSAAVAGIVLGGIALLFVWLAWPMSRWAGDVAGLMSPLRLVAPALANAVVLLGSYLAVASLAWGMADATMDQPRDLPAFDLPTDGHSWRVVHLSDLHVVGERYGFRIESGRSGACGNERLARVLEKLQRFTWASLSILI